jgi:hypothetical protein
MPKKSPNAQLKEQTKEDVKKWFKTGPVDEITREDWFKMDPIHRNLYNNYRRKSQLESELKQVEEEIAALSAPIMEVIKTNPLHPFNKWAWIERMPQTKPKWKEIAISINEKKALKLAKEYAQKIFPFLRIKYIHPNKD